MGEPGGLPSLGSHRVGHDWSDLAAAAAAAREMRARGLQLKKHDPYFLSITLINCAQNRET